LELAATCHALCVSGSESMPAPSLARTVADLNGRALCINVAIGFVALAAVIVSMAAAPGLDGLFGAALALLMMAIAVIDARQFIIPNMLNAAGFTLGLLHAVFQEPALSVEAATMAVARGAVLALVFLAIRIFYARLRGRQGLGLGDVKLAGVAGSWLDWLTMPIAIEIAALTALAIYVLRHIFGRPMSATTRLPFGLFLAPTIWLCWLLEATLLRP
jgi:leader peptidase (prepilin peptidase)/N-methyltransferase